MGTMTETLPAESPSTPLFVYGWLLRSEGPRRGIEESIDHAMPATVSAHQLANWPGATAEPNTVHGQLLWFLTGQADEAMRHLTKIEGPGFEIASVDASTPSGVVAAAMFRWRGTHRNLDHYLHAARRKMAIAEHELASLEEQLAEQMPIEAPVSVQADFEGVLYAFDAAVDQLVSALRLERRSFAGALPDLGECLRSARLWLTDPVVRDMASVRNDATHAYYDKRPADGLWRVVSLRRGPEVDHGDIMSFARRGVSHLRKLRPILVCLAAAQRTD